MKAAANARELGAALERAHAVRPERAIIAIGRVDGARWEEAEQAIRAFAAQVGGDVIVERVDGPERNRERLTELNRGRDVLLATCRVIALLATTPEGQRAILDLANDLAVAPSLTVEMRGALPTGSWPALAEALRQRAVQNNSVLDLTGLLPGSAEQASLPLRDVYMNLVELPRRRPEQGPEVRRWLALGNPGAGKTTFLRRLALSYGEHGKDPLQVGHGVPVLVSLADYGLARQREILPLARFIPEWLAAQGVPDSGALAGHWSEVVLLLDGLDELRDATGRRDVLDQLRRWPDGEGPRAVVVSGRLNVVDDLREADLSQIQLLSCRPPRSDEVQRFVERFANLRALPGAGRRLDAANFVHRLSVDRNLSELAQNPLLLVFLVLLEELEGRLPERRSEVYYRMGELLVERWTRARSMAATASQRRATRADALRVLGPLAAWVVEQGGSSLAQSSLLSGLAEIEARRGGSAGAELRARTLLDLLERDTALLVRDAQRRWAFAHPSIAEYFAAIETCRDPGRWRSLLEDPFQSERRELVTFAAGYLGVISAEDAKLHELVGAVLDRSRRQGRYDARYALLIMALLREQPGLAPRDEEALVRRLGVFLFDRHYGRASARVVQTEAVAFLLQGVGTSYEAAICATLAEWTSRPLRWDRLLRGALYTFEQPPAADDWFRAEELVTGELLWNLPRVLEEYGLESAQVIATMQRSERWEVRYAGWASVILDRPNGTEVLAKLALQEPELAPLVRLNMDAEQL